MPLKNFFSTQFSMLVLCIIMFSCSTEKIKPAGLYNIDSLISAQIDYMIEHQARINKRAVLNNKEKVTSSIPKDTLDWENELAIFSELDMINKPINKGEYKIEEYNDIKSNLKVRSFVTTEDLPVKYLKIYYQHTPNRVRKIQAQYNESNSLYASSRFLTMEFEDVFNKTILTSYSIEGGQKMFLDDSVQYSVGVTISLKN